MTQNKNNFPDDISYRNYKKLSPDEREEYHSENPEILETMTENAQRINDSITNNITSSELEGVSEKEQLKFMKSNPALAKAMKVQSDVVQNGALKNLNKMTNVQRAIIGNSSRIPEPQENPFRLDQLFPPSKIATLGQILNEEIKPILEKSIETQNEHKSIAEQQVVINKEMINQLILLRKESNDTFRWARYTFFLSLFGIIVGLIQYNFDFIYRIILKIMER
ncbi:MAG: hypothetical protein KBA38_00980 [Negativicutes bacterium]|nr:hypothetical protein [Negativicutes bacterium]